MYRSKMSLLYSFVCVLIIVQSQVNTDATVPDSSPKAIALRVGRRIIDDESIFLVWDYGGALIFDGLDQTSQLFGFNFTSNSDHYLDIFKEQPWNYAYKLLHGIPIPTENTVGDYLGFFPIAYLNRALRAGSSFNNTDWTIVQLVSDRVLLWPKRLHDGLVSRDSGWPGEPEECASFVWADDQYMGLVLLARLAQATRNYTLASYVTKQALLFVRHLVDQNDGLYYHGYNDVTGHRSCCKWGRANGWALMAHAELLKMRQHLNLTSTDLMNIFQSHSAALLKYQSADGRFHQVINETTTYLETSATAMIVTSWARGLRQGWLPRKVYITPLLRAWRRLTSTVKDDGKVKGICMGTGIQTSLADYAKRPCVYILSGDGGLGAVLMASAEMELYNRSMG